MDSSFYLGLSNSGPREQATIGADYAPQKWSPRSLSPVIQEVRRALFVAPHLPEAINWRAAEICRLIERIDLASFLLRFKLPMAYDPATLTVAMAELFEISFSDPQFAQKFRLHPRIRTPSYQLHDLTLQVGLSDWRVVFDQEVFSGEIAGQTTVNLTVYGQHALTFPVDVPGNWSTRFASPPTVSLADTSRVLRQEARPAVYNLLRLPSTLPEGTLSLVKQILDSPQDPAVTVCAVSLAVAGATLASPVLA